jgi:hypothetical protein
VVWKKRNKKMKREVYQIRNESAVVLCSICLAPSANTAGMIARDCFSRSAFMEIYPDLTRFPDSRLQGHLAKT